MHAAPAIGTFHAAGHSASYRVFGPMLRRLIERLDRKVVVSKDALALVRGHLGGDYQMLFNGVETYEIAAVPPFRSPAGRPSLFFVGRHEERKGLDVLLAALGRLDCDVECWVAGEGPDTSRLRAAYAHDDRIEWLGRISDPEKLARMRGASVFCAPSLHGESFGVVLIEAMAAGTPVVASALDGYRNVATDDVDAVLVPPGDVDALAAALRRVLGDRSLASRLVEAGRARAATFAMSTLAEAYVELYTEVVEEARVGRGRAT